MKTYNMEIDLKSGYIYVVALSISERLRKVVLFGKSNPWSFWTICQASKMVDGKSNWEW